MSEGPIPVYGTGGYMLSVDKSLSDIDAVGIGRKGTIDHPRLLHAPFWTVDTLFFLTVNKDNKLNFVFYLLENIQWKKYDESTGVPSLSKNTIENINVKVPTELDQKSIGSLLSLIDVLIAANEDHLKLSIKIECNLEDQLIITS